MSLISNNWPQNFSFANCQLLQPIKLHGRVDVMPIDFFFHVTLMILSFRTDWSGQTVQTQILEVQSDHGLHCLLFHLHLFDEIP